MGKWAQEDTRHPLAPADADYAVVTEQYDGDSGVGLGEV